MPIAQFMRRYWQRRPLVVRKALADFSAPLDRKALFALAARDDVESRLVTAVDGWRLAHGPIAPRRIPPLRKPGWTLLVQGTEQHDDRAADLLARFRFVSDARLDDLMMSYASDGGGVGPHIDAYDVFLLQAQGRRRWRIGNADADDLLPGAPLKILRHFRHRLEWVLEAGDLLYLPPGVAHEGTALGGDCITCSIGFRAPSWRELVEPWLDVLASHPSREGRYADPGIAPTRHPGRLPGALVDAAFAALTRTRPARADARRTLLTYLTEPKANVVFARPRRALTAQALSRAGGQRGLRLDRRSRMLYSAMSIAINGEVVADTGKDGTLMQALADQRALTPGQAMALGRDTWQTLAAWHQAGWVHVAF
jgi:50S ribosomal protein L16 3-hydroxylase